MQKKYFSVVRKAKLSCLVRAYSAEEARTRVTNSTNFTEDSIEFFGDTKVIEME